MIKVIPVPMGIMFDMTEEHEFSFFEDHMLTPLDVLLDLPQLEELAMWIPLQFQEAVQIELNAREEFRKEFN